MSKRGYYQTFIDDYFDDSFAKYFRIMDDSMSSSAASAAVSESKQYNSSAVYDIYSRFREPTMANSYMAIKKSFNVPSYNGLNASSQLVVQSFVSAPGGSVLRWEPVFTTAQLLGPGQLSATAYDIYDQFRIRAVHVSATSCNQARDNVQPIEKYVWYVGNHAEYDAEYATTLTTYTQMLQVKNCGEVIQSYGRGADRGFALTYVPQVVQTDQEIGDPNQSDVPCPWLDTNLTDKSIVMRGPVMIFREPYKAGADDQEVARYTVTWTAMIEFRYVDSNKL